VVTAPTMDSAVGLTRDQRDALLSPRQRAALPGSYRDTLFGVLRWLLPALALLVLATIVIWPLTKVREFSFLLAKDKVAMAEERLRIDRPVYRGETSKGEAFVISAAGAVQRSSAVPIVELTDLKAKLQLSDGPLTVNAPSGRYFLDDDKLQIAGPVLLESTSGFSLDSEQVDIDINARSVSTDTPVSGTVPLGSFRAGRMQADIRGRTVVLDGGAHLRIYQRGGTAAR
jgi:lipopolysaccharide export system protein LptC